MKRLRWWLAALTASVAVPAALLGALPTAGHAGGEGGPILTIDGTVCWEKVPPDGTKPDDAGSGPTRSGTSRSTAETRLAANGTATVVVSISEAVKEPLTVVVSTADGTAKAPDDFTALDGLEVTIPAGERSVTVSLEIRDDEEREPDEWFTVRIDKASAGTIGKGEAEVIIKDGAPPPKK